MRLEDFIKELYDAGWHAVADAQHDRIKDVHKKLFPVIAELEGEVFELDCIVNP